MCWSLSLSLSLCHLSVCVHMYNRSVHRVGKVSHRAERRLHCFEGMTMAGFLGPKRYSWKRKKKEKNNGEIGRVDINRLSPLQSESSESCCSPDIAQPVALFGRCERGEMIFETQPAAGRYLNFFRTVLSGSLR